MTSAKIFFHDCGATYELLPDLIEVGHDILKTRRASTRGMDAKRLKREFGKDTGFWAAGWTPSIFCSSG
jgi:uroporphyrinogen decarboxylase